MVDINDIDTRNHRWILIPILIF